MEEWGIDPPPFLPPQDIEGRFHSINLSQEMVSLKNSFTAQSLTVFSNKNKLKKLFERARLLRWNFG